MNSDLNSDSKQCPGSSAKCAQTGPWLRSLRSCRAHSAVSQAWPYRVAAMSQACTDRTVAPSWLCCACARPYHGRGVARCMGALSQAVCCALCHAPYRCVGRRVARLQRHIMALPVPYRGTSLGRVVPVSRYNPAAKPRVPCTGRPCRGHGWPYRNACRAPQHAPTWPCRGLVPLLCHDTMHCIMTHAGKMGSSPFQHLHCFFFFTFFFPFDLLEDHKK